MNLNGIFCCFKVVVRSVKFVATILLSTTILNDTG